MTNHIKIKTFIATGVLAFAFLSSRAVFASEPDFYRDPSLPDWAPFSSAVTVGDTIYVSGHLGRDPETNKLISDDAADQTRQTLANMERTLKAVGAELSDVVKCTIFLDDMADYTAMNAAYAESFPGDKPARSTIGADGLAIGAKVEIECIAVKPSVED